MRRSLKTAISGELFFALNSNSQDGEREESRRESAKSSPSQKVIQVNKQKLVAYITTHVTDENAAILGRALLGQEVEAHRDDVAAVASSHAVRISKVARMNGAAVRTVEEDFDVHCAGLARRRHLRCEIRSILWLNLQRSRRKRKID